MRRAFADDLLRELERRKRLLGILGFDDLLSRLAVALEADDAPARDGIGSRIDADVSPRMRTPQCTRTSTPILRSGAGPPPSPHTPGKG